uniref:Uncharacterized protein n=1 Tax=Sipha flava TaxID=143950 RepID=A0A2S2R8H9_9HEMI
MYLLTFLVFQGVQLLIRASEPSVNTNDTGVRDGKINSIDATITNSLEEKLIAEVDKYFRRIEQNDLLKFNYTIPDYKCGNIIQHMDVQKLENNIYIILSQMYNYCIREILDKDTVLKNRNLEKKIISLFQSYYVHTICTHIPRCLDFIYICAPTFTNFGKILSLHSDICLTRNEYLTKYYSQVNSNDESLYFTEIDTIRINWLYKSLSKTKLISIETKFYTAKDDETFIKSIFEIINKIDKTNMIPSSDWYGKSILNDYSLSKKLETHYIRSPYLIMNDSNRNEIHKLNLGLKKVIFEQGNALMNPINYNEVPESNDNLMVNCNSALNELLLNILRAIKFHFRNIVLDVLNDNDLEQRTVIIDQNAIIKVLPIEMLDRLCKYIPLILYHLFSAYITDRNVFSLYLTMCSDWINFLYVRCLCDKSEDGKFFYNPQCVKQSVNEKLMVNYYMITQKAIYDDEFMNDVPDVENLESITQSIYTELYQFYTSKPVFLWTSFVWLSSVSIFTQTLSYDHLNEIRQKTVKIGLKKIPVTELYNQLLPWNTNLRTLIDFKTLIEKCFIRKLFRYVWRHATLIFIYFQFTDVKDVTDEVFQRLKKSTKWYRSGTQELYQFMEATIVGFKIPEEIKFVIKEIERMSVKTIGQFNVCMKYIKEKYEKKKKSRTNIFSRLRSTDFVTRLNRYFLNNCIDAVNFINNYISFVNNSRVTLNMNTYVVQELCKNDNLHNVFVENESVVNDSHTHVPNNESTQEDIIKR